MRVYGTDMCMQGECCARIASVCTEDNAESPRALNVALFVAHGAIEASVKALEAARRLDDLAVAEAACKALAALLQGRLPVQNQVVALVLSGGNIDADTFASCLQQFPNP